MGSGVGFNGLTRRRGQVAENVLVRWLLGKRKRTRSPIPIIGLLALVLLAFSIPFKRAGPDAEGEGQFVREKYAPPIRDGHILPTQDEDQGEDRQPAPPAQIDSRAPSSNATAVEPGASRQSVNGWPEECGLYYATSTIPNSGFGLFAGVDHKGGIQLDPADINIPFVNLDWHNEAKSQDFDWGQDNPEYWGRGYHLLYNEYFWSGRSVNMTQEGEVVQVLSLGWGALANSHPGLFNLKEGRPEYDGAGVHRYSDPGAGAFSPYHNRRPLTRSAIHAGDELFVDYGPKWFLSRVDDIGFIPLGEDYDKADQFLRYYQSFSSEVPGWETVSREIKEDFWGLIRGFYHRDSRVLNALPQSFSDVDLAMRKGVRELARIKTPLEWLKENGKCMDNLRPMPSTIRQAGRGAFATRFLSKGSPVASAPLIHVPRGKEVFRMYGHNVSATGEWVRDLNRPTGYQLITNYCFGHPESTVMLSPYGPSVPFINHKRWAPNVRIQWTNPDHTWLTKSVDFLETTQNAQLSFDLIATRDIYPGEEVFLDYGQEWQDAWGRHVRDWTAPDGANNYIDHAEMNAREEHIVLRTVYEQEADPYPVNVATWCRYHVSKRVWEAAASRPIEDTVPIEDRVRWNSSYDEEKHHPCTILSKTKKIETGEFQYTVRILSVLDSTLGPFGMETRREGGLPKGRTAIVESMPREAIIFQNHRYQTDFHLPSTFRHNIVVPDDMFPRSWRNLAKEA